MARWWNSLMGKAAVSKSLFRFLWTQRLWWMIPMMVVLLLFGTLLILAQQSVFFPFTYTLF